MQEEPHEMSAQSVLSDIQDWAKTIFLMVALTSFCTMALFVLTRIWPHTSHTTAQAVMNSATHAQTHAAVKIGQSPTIETKLKQIEMRLTQVQAMQIRQEKGQ